MGTWYIPVHHHHCALCSLDNSICNGLPLNHTEWQQFLQHVHGIWGPCQLGESQPSCRWNYWWYQHTSCWCLYCTLTHLVLSIENSWFIVDLAVLGALGSSVANYLVANYLCCCRNKWVLLLLDVPCTKYFRHEDSTNSRCFPQSYGWYKQDRNFCAKCWLVINVCLTDSCNNPHMHALDCLSHCPLCT